MISLIFHIGSFISGVPGIKMSLIQPTDAVAPAGSPDFLDDIQYPVGVAGRR